MPLPLKMFQILPMPTLGSPLSSTCSIMSFEGGVCEKSWRWWVRLNVSGSRPTKGRVITREICSSSQILRAARPMLFRRSNPKDSSCAAICHTESAEV